MVEPTVDVEVGCRICGADRYRVGHAEWCERVKARQRQMEKLYGDGRRAQETGGGQGG